MSVNTKINGQLVKLAGLYDIGSSGILPKLIITSEAGDALSVVSGSGKTITPTQVSGSTTEWECDIDSYGTCSVTSTLASETKYLDISEVKIYTLTISPVPQGSVVTPTDDIQTWLACAGIKDKSYTTLAEVLADRATFETLIADSNACDYMARSTTWAVNEGAVPLMTSNTTPSGVASCSSYITSDGVDAYKAFDQSNSSGNTMDMWATATLPAWIAYKFTSAKCIKKVYFENRNYSSDGNRRIKTYKVQASNDDFVSDIHDLTDSITRDNSNNVAKGADTVYLTDNDDSYTSYRLYITERFAEAGNQVGCAILQFYEDADITTDQDAMSLIGKYDYCSNALLGNATWAEAIANSDYFEEVLNVKVPVMTSNTAPSGECIASGSTSSSAPWYCFRDTYTTSDNGQYWQSDYQQNPWIGYKFPNKILLKKYFQRRTYQSGNSGRDMNTVNIQASNDGINWVNLATNVTINNNTPNELTQMIFPNNSTKYQYFRIYEVTGSTIGTLLTQVQFYGRTPIASQAIQLNPNMTSATTPYGEVITDATPLSNTQPYYAFDGTILDMFKAELANKYLGYIFETPTVVKRFTINSNQTTAGQRWYKAKLQVSTDGTTWTDFDTYTNTEHANVFTVDIDNSTEYLGYRFYFLDDEITGACFINIIAFYGAPINTVIHSAKSDTIYTYIDGVQTTLTTTNYSKGIGYCDFSQLEAGTYTLYSSVAKDPNDLSKPYTKDIVITKTPYGNTTEVYFMPDTVKTLYWYGYENEMEDCMPVNGWSYSSYTLTSPTHNTNDVYVISQSSGISAYATKKPITSSSVKFVVECGSGGRLLFPSNKVASDNIESIGTVYSTKTLLTKQNISSKYVGVEGFFGVTNNSVKLYALWYE